MWSRLATVRSHSQSYGGNETSYLSIIPNTALPYAIQHQQGVFSYLADILDNQHLLRVSCISSIWVTLPVVKIFVICKCIKCLSALTYLINSQVQVSDLHKCVLFLSQRKRWTLIYYLNVTPEDIE